LQSFGLELRRESRGRWSSSGTVAAFARTVRVQRTLVLFATRRDPPVARSAPNHHKFSASKRPFITHTRSGIRTAHSTLRSIISTDLVKTSARAVEHATHECARLLTRCRFPLPRTITPSTSLRTCPRSAAPPRSPRHRLCLLASHSRPVPPKRCGTSSGSGSHPGAVPHPCTCTRSHPKAACAGARGGTIAIELSAIERVRTGSTAVRVPVPAVSVGWCRVGVQRQVLGLDTPRTGDAGGVGLVALRCG
jgi:hypothetical protein